MIAFIRIASISYTKSKQITLAYNKPWDFWEIIYNDFERIIWNLLKACMKTELYKNRSYIE
jgi:hypothetical protein